MKFNWDDIMTSAEATERWGLSNSTIRRALMGKRFLDGEYKKSGKVWIIKKSAMERLYGKEPRE
jgi:hypothetical protein